MKKSSQGTIDQWVVKNSFQSSSSSSSSSSVISSSSSSSSSFSSSSSSNALSSSSFVSTSSSLSSSEDLIATKDWIRKQKEISAQKDEIFCIHCKQSQKSTNFTTKGSYKCKTCAQKYSVEYRKKRRAMPDSKFQENKSAKQDILNSLKCSDCFVFTQGNYNRFYYF